MSDDKGIVLVTGASQGIGAATASAFARAGWKVVLAARNADKLDAVAAALGADCLAVPCDVADPDSVEALFARIRDTHGRLDAVFNNAGTNIGAKLAGDVTWDEWRRVVSVNLDGAFLIASAAFRLMRDQTPRAAASSTTARSRPSAPPTARSPTPPPSTPSPASPSRSPSTAAPSTSPAARSTSATPPPT